MKRYIPVAVAIGFAVVVGIFALSSMNAPSSGEYRLARGRAQLSAENYLGALQTLRDIPNIPARGSETHAYLGAAYLRLHLYKAAIKEFEEAVKMRPRQSDPWIGLASTYIELGNAPKAIEEANRATEVEKRSSDAWIILGRAQWLQQSFDEAEKAALKARELDSHNPGAADLLLHIYFDQNDANKFQSELNRSSNPSKPIQDLARRFFVRQEQFARAYELKTRYERNDLQRSVLETELALKREPGRLELYPQLIKNLVRTGRYIDAIDAAKKYQGPAALDFEVGKAHWMLGQKDLAIKAYQRASTGLVHKLSAEVALAAITGDIRHWHKAYEAERVEQDYFILARLEDILPNASPMVRAFIYRYAGIYDSNFYTKVADAALEVLKDQPTNFDALMTIATAYHRIGRGEEASRYLETAQQTYPKSAEPVSRLANIALTSDEKDVTKIIGLMDRAVKLDPNNAGYLYNLGWIYDQIGETGKAIDLYQRAIKSSPLSFEAMNNLAIIYGNANQPERALPLLEQAIRSDPETEVGYFNFANYYFRRREWKQAVEYYDRALQLNPSSVAAAVERGRTYLEMGRTEDAVESLNRALEIDSHLFDAYMLLSSAYEKMGRPKEATAATDEAQRLKKDSSK